MWKLDRSAFGGRLDVAVAAIATSVKEVLQHAATGLTAVRLPRFTYHTKRTNFSLWNARTCQTRRVVHDTLHHCAAIATQPSLLACLNVPPSHVAASE